MTYLIVLHRVSKKYQNSHSVHESDKIKKTNMWITKKYLLRTNSKFDFEPRDFLIDSANSDSNFLKPLEPTFKRSFGIGSIEISYEKHDLQ